MFVFVLFLLDKTATRVSFKWAVLSVSMATGEPAHGCLRVKASPWLSNSLLESVFRNTHSPLPKHKQSCFHHSRVSCSTVNDLTTAFLGSNVLISLIYSNNFWFSCEAGRYLNAACFGFKWADLSLKQTFIGC